MKIEHFAKQIIRFEIWILLALSAVSLFWISLLPAVIILAVFFWAMRIVGYGYLTLRTPADWGIILLCFFMLVSVYITPRIDITTTQVWRALSGIVLFYAVVNWCSSRFKIRIFYTGLMAAGLFLALIAPFSVEWALDKLTFIPINLYERFSIQLQDTINPSVLAGSLVILLPFPLTLPFLGWKRSNWLERVLAVTAVFLILGMLFLTRARGAWIAAGTSILFMLLLTNARIWLFIAMGGIGLLFLVSTYGISQVSEILLYSNTIGGLEERFEIWSRSLTMIRDFSFSGIGMGSFLETVNTFYPFDKYSPQDIPHAHNIFLQVSLDLGLPGLITWLSILIVIIVISWKVLKFGKSIKNGYIYAVGAALIGSQIALIVNGLTDSVTWGMVRPAPLVWLIWGFAAAIAGSISSKKPN